MDLTTIVTILIICDLCIDITQNAGSGDDRNYPQTPRPDLAYMKSAKDKRLGSSYDDKMKNRESSIGESSSARIRSTENIKIEHDSKGTSRRKTWTNEEYKALLRLAYAHYDRTAQNGTGAINWKAVVTRWFGDWDVNMRDVLRIPFHGLQRRMRNAIKNYDKGLNTWPRHHDDELLKIYFATEAGSKSKHAERIYAEWVTEHPEYYKVAPAYLLSRAEKMIFSVMKFSVNNPQGAFKQGRHVDWQPEHNNLFLHLLKKYSEDDPERLRHITDEFIERFPGTELLGRRRVYDHIRFMDKRAANNHKKKALNKGSVQNTTHIQHHPFTDDHNFLSLSLGIHGHHVGTTSKNSQPRQSHDGPDHHSHQNISNAEKNPDTELKLGW